LLACTAGFDGSSSAASSSLLEPKASLREACEADASDSGSGTTERNSGMAKTPKNSKTPKNGAEITFHSLSRLALGKSLTKLWS
jgi:hypothetical protein